MESLRKEIKDEMTRSRLDKARLYELLEKIVDTVANGAGREGPAGPQGPAGAQGPAGPAGSEGPEGVCKCACVKEEKKSAPVVSKKKSSTSDASI